MEIADFPTDRLLVVGTTGADAIALQSQANGIKFTTKWNGVTSERRTYDPKQIKQVQMYLLGDDDFLSVTGSASLALDIHGGRGNDWIYVSNLSATITDLYGDNIITTGAGDDIIHTGPGDDEIDAGGGQNQITDDGGTNSITTGGQNDQIHHANIQDWILAGAGVNDIWLNGVHQGWHNALKPADVNHDGVITPLDAILVINLLNALGGHVLAGSADSSSNLYDTSADGFVAPLDALLIINELNFYVGEGETSVPSGSEGAGEEQLQRTGHIEIAPLLLPLDNPIARATTGQQQQTVLAQVGIPTEYRDLAIVADRHKNSELSVDACFADSEADEPFWCELIHERTTVKRNRLKAR